MEKKKGKMANEYFLTPPHIAPTVSDVSRITAVQIKIAYRAFGREGDGGK